MTDEVAGVEFAGLENDGLENDGLENDRLENDRLENDGLENDGVVQEQTYAFKVKPVLFEGTVWSTALTPTSNDTG